MSALRSRLTVREYRQVLKVLCNNVELFEIFHEQLEVSHFGSLETYQLIYRILLNFYSEHSELPTSELMWIEVESLLENMPEHFSSEELEELEDFLNQDYDGHPVDEAMCKWASSKIKQLIEESVLRDMASRASSEVLPASLPDMLEGWEEKLTHLESLGHAETSTQTYQPEWDRAAGLNLRSTGLSFLDDFLAGGHCAGEVYGILAPYGTCKTTIAAMLCCNEARNAQATRLALAEAITERIGLSVLVSYEAPKSPELQHRFLMYMGQIQRASLAAMDTTGLECLSGDETSPLQYEQKRFAQQISDGMFRTERTRVEEVVSVMNPYSLVLDMTGNDPGFRRAGGGGLKEIAARLKAELAHRSRDSVHEYYIENIVIDYVGAMVKRQLAASGEDSTDLRHQITAAPLMAANLLAKPFKCPVWLIHQLSGQANSSFRPGSRLHHTDSAESKSFAENLDFAFVIGNLNDKSQGQISCTKHRRAAGKPSKVIEVDGDFNTVFARDDLYIDTTTLVVVDKDIAQTVGYALPVVNEHQNEQEDSNQNEQEDSNHNEEITEWDNYYDNDGSEPSTE